MSSSAAVAVEPPQGCRSRDELDKKHATELAFLETRIKTLSRPAFGKKPIASASVQLQSAAMREELRLKHEAEQAQLAAYLEYAATLPKEEPAAAAAAAPAAGAVADAGSDAAAAPVGGAGTAADGTADGTPAADAATGGPKKSRAQRRLEKKRAAAAGDASDSDDGKPAPLSAKEAEIASIQGVIGPLGYDMNLVPPDGHCLFRAVADQLSALAASSSSSASSASSSSGGGGGGGDATLDYMGLRKRATDYIRHRPHAFAPFLPYEPSDGYPEGTHPSAYAVEAAVEKYCHRMATTGAWGGHPELRALASTLGLPIVVYQAGAEPWRFGPDDDAIDKSRVARKDEAEVVLRLTYHKRYYALGEHYNSVVPKKAEVAWSA